MNKIKKPEFYPNFIWYFLRWMRGPLWILDGIFIFISFGFFAPDFALKFEGFFLDYGSKERFWR